MRRSTLWIAIALFQSGCASLQDWHFCAVNECRATLAWYGAHYDKRAIPAYHDFAHGWRSGYYDVSQGGCGRPPAVPPRCYWSADYQTDEGAAAIDAWYQGFQEGALAAEREGYGAYSTLRAHGSNYSTAPMIMSGDAPPFEAPGRLQDLPAPGQTLETLPAPPLSLPSTSPPDAASDASHGNAPTALMPATPASRAKPSARRKSFQTARTSTPLRLRPQGPPIGGGALIAAGKSENIVQPETSNPAGSAAAAEFALRPLPPIDATNIIRR
jgi:hypothetical protein